MNNIVFKFFMSFFRQLFATTIHSEKVRSDYDFLVTLRLRNINNIFGGDAIWTPDFNSEGLEGELNGKPFNSGLYQALFDTPLKTVGKNPQNNLAITENSYFTDVVIFIQEEKWEYEALKGGAQLYVLASRLKDAHKRAFGNDLLYKRNPRYCVMPATEAMALQENEVLIQYGLSVFIPDENDEQVASLTLRSHNIGYALSPWIFFTREGERIERHATLYRGQNTLRFASANSLQSCFSVPKWFTPPCQNEWFMLRFDQRKDSKANQVNIERMGKPFVLKKSMLTTRSPAPIKRGMAMSYTFYSPKNERIGLELYPKDYQDAHDITDHDGAVIGKTYIPMGGGSASIESQEAFVSLAYLALPEQSMLPAGYDWELAFNESGQLIDTTATAAQPYIHFFLQNNEIFYQTEAMDSAESAESKQLSSIQIGIHEFNLLPSPDIIDNQDSEGNNNASLSYRRLLRLPAQWQKTHLKFEQFSILLGRDNEKAHYNLLNQNGTINDGNTAHTSTLHNLSYSGEHVELTYEKNCVVVRQLSENAPAIILNQDLKREQLLLPSDGRVLQLNSGQAIILGCYVYQIYLPGAKQNTPPKQETPKQETPKQETPKQETPKEETPKQETPKEETPKEETPKEETPKQEIPKEETPKQEVSKQVDNKANDTDITKEDNELA